MAAPTTTSASTPTRRVPTSPSSRITRATVAIPPITASAVATRRETPVPATPSSSPSRTPAARAAAVEGETGWSVDGAVASGRRGADRFSSSRRAGAAAPVHSHQGTWFARSLSGCYAPKHTELGRVDTVRSVLGQPQEMGGAQSPAAAAGRLETAIWVAAVLFTLLGLLVTLALLWQPGATHPWARLDIYTGGFLLVGGLAGIAQAAIFLRSALRSLGVAGEALGLTYDPGVILFVLVLEPGKLAVVLDYARWHLVPALEQPALQTLGLALAVAGSAGLIWTDRWLARHFASEVAAASLMTRGPYAVVRHPRYLSMLLLGLGSPLVFASILGWPLWYLMVVVVLRRIEREEPHLRELFGAAYDAYARRTARLVPGLY